MGWQSSRPRSIPKCVDMLATTVPTWFTRFTNERDSPMPTRTPTIFTMESKAFYASRTPNPAI